MTVERKGQAQDTLKTGNSSGTLANKLRYDETPSQAEELLYKGKRGCHASTIDSSGPQKIKETSGNGVRMKEASRGGGKGNSQGRNLSRES